MVAPELAKGCRVLWIGPHRPPHLRGLELLGVFRLARRPPGRSRRIWHARRNVEMMLGLLLRTIGFPLALVFTSAGLRHHSWITRFLIGRMDAVIASSEAAASFLKRPAVVIPHGVDVSTFSPPADRSAAFAATGLPGKLGVGLFGRVRPSKGTDLFVEAMCRLLPRYPDFTAVVIGRTTLEHQKFLQRLRDRVKEAGLADRLRFLGEVPVDDVPRWYRSIGIYVFASREEGFGLTLLEAMAAGAALVATRAGAAAKVVVDGETGMLVPTDHVDQLVAALEQLMRDPLRAAEMGRRGRERVVANFSVEREAEQILSVYRRLVIPQAT
jgi:mannosyltransferase